MYVLTYNNGAGDYIVTDSYFWSTAFSANIQEGDLDIYVKNVNGDYIENAYVKLYDENWNFEDDYTNSSGKADFNNMAYGTYHYEVRYTGDAQEFWGDDDIDINSSNESVTFTRNWPYRYSYELPATNINLNETVTYKITIKNKLTFSRNTKVELWVDRNQSSSGDFHEISNYQTISSNNTKTYSFNFAPTSTGTYYWKMHVLSYNDGAGDYIVTDSYYWSSSFEIEDEPIFPLNEGVIIYHSYSNYDAWDSKLFMYDFGTKSKTEISKNWNIDHEMNAHISPDGSKIVFMGDDSGLPRDWDIYIWNIGTNNAPINLTSSNNLRDEDPKFSPDGNSIVFKQNGDIKIMNLSGNITTVISNDGYTIEESMPYFTSDGQHIIYAKNAGEYSDICLVDLDGSNETELYCIDGVSEYYPIVKNSTSVFYTRWVSSSNHNDQIYQGDFSGNYGSLSINDVSSNNSDAYPVDDDYLFFSSTRSGSIGGYDLYIGQISTGYVWNLNNFNINTSQEDLGTCYTPQVNIITDVINSHENIIANYCLYNNFPNPFNPTTIITYQLPKDSNVILRIFNINGKLVKILVKEKQKAGFYKIQWNGKNEKDNSVASGIYLYQIKAGDYIKIKKCLLLK
jgi:Tol biopolymer transport system component